MSKVGLVKNTVVIETTVICSKCGECYDKEFEVPSMPKYMRCDYCQETNCMKIIDIRHAKITGLPD